MILSLAPDIISLAETHELSVEEVISLHTAKIYRVYMIGFLPGFAYMGSVDEKLTTPRRMQPRTIVPAGSVGIAGEQTGIYPFDSPGGWQLIGQTPLQMFDATGATPCYLHPGDEVQFHAISIEEFKKAKKT
jgi:inhibitor of KinA